MIRRSPTRIELKLDDIQEFDYVHYDKKKTAQAAADTVANITAQTAAKLLRHERIGYHRAEANMARRTGGPPGGGGNNANPPSTTTTTAEATTPAPTTTQSATTTAATSTVTTGVTATSTPLPAETTTSSSSEPVSSAANLDPANLPSEIEHGESIYMDLAEFNSTYASANMSMDET